jgi:hypothetical protein
MLCTLPVLLQVENAAELIGYFVPPDTYCKLVLATMEDSANAKQLRVFAAILKGSDRTTLKEQLTDIGNFLKCPETCWSKEVLVVVQDTQWFLTLYHNMFVAGNEHLNKTVTF